MDQYQLTRESFQETLEVVRRNYIKEGYDQVFGLALLNMMESLSQSLPPTTESPIRDKAWDVPAREHTIPTMPVSSQSGTVEQQSGHVVQDCKCAEPQPMLTQFYSFSNGILQTRCYNCDASMWYGRILVPVVDTGSLISARPGSERSVGPESVGRVKSPFRLFGNH